MVALLLWAFDPEYLVTGRYGYFDVVVVWTRGTDTRSVWLLFFLWACQPGKPIPDLCGCCFVLWACQLEEPVPDLCGCCFFLWACQPGEPIPDLCGCCFFLWACQPGEPIPDLCGCCFFLRACQLEDPVKDLYFWTDQWNTTYMNTMRGQSRSVGRKEGNSDFSTMKISWLLFLLWNQSNLVTFHFY